MPDGSIVVPTYNEGGYLEHLEVTIMGQGSPVVFMDGQDFDAKGQRQYVKYGNDTITKFFYDANTFRLTRLLTMEDDTPTATSLQDLNYTYDPVGNITEVQDLAQQTYYYSNQVIAAEKKYTYDELYRLKSATGREHISLGLPGTNNPSHKDLAHLPGMPPASNLGAVRRYTQTYQYDKVDNILEMKHLRSTGGGWTRTYNYGTDASNKLLSNNIGGNTYTYVYDAHGNMIGMPHLQALNWNFQDQLQSVELLGSSGTAYYNYDASGQRVRKVVVKASKREERIYLGGVERYREYTTSTGSTVDLERWTLQVEDIAQVDTLKVENGVTITTLEPAIRYQYKDHLGSATLETNGAGVVISYEEYHPFGSSAYRVEKSGTNLSLKRYRFTNKERDDETGLYYFGVRYYAAWLGRWTSADPGGLVDGLNLYQYGRNNPVKLVDKEGYSAVEPDTEGDPIKKHQIKENDNLTNIAKKYNTTVDKLIEWNNLGGASMSGSGFYPGDELIVSNGGIELDSSVFQYNFNWGGTSPTHATEPSDGVIDGVIEAIEEEASEIYDLITENAWSIEYWKAVGWGTLMLLEDVAVSTSIVDVFDTEHLDAVFSDFEREVLYGTPKSRAKYLTSLGIGLLLEKGLSKAALKGTGKVGDVGSFRKNTGTGIEGDDLTGDHLPSGAAVIKRIQDELGVELSVEDAKIIYNEATTLMITDAIHKAYSETYGGRNTVERIAADAANLRGAATSNMEALRPHLKKTGLTDSDLDSIFENVHKTNVEFFRQFGIKY